MMNEISLSDDLKYDLRKENKNADLEHVADLPATSVSVKNLIPELSNSCILSLHRRKTIQSGSAKSFTESKKLAACLRCSRS